jgi:hypothetical protein
MPGFNQQEIAKLQTYMQNKFGNKNIAVKSRKINDSVEVTIGGEFLGTVYKDEEDGETSYDFNMAILDIDLEEAA